MDEVNIIHEVNIILSTCKGLTLYDQSMYIFSNLTVFLKEYQQ